MPVLNLFESSRCKIARSKEHIENLDREIGAFFKDNPTRVVFVPDPQIPDGKTYKLKFTKPFPCRFSMIAGDAISNLRAALDHAGYAVAVGARSPSLTKTAFPFGGSIAGLETSIQKNSKHLPSEILTLFRGFKPYKGGDDKLWALNQIANADKHTVLIPKLGMSVLQAIRGQIPGSGCFIPQKHVWDAANQEIILLTTTESNPDYKFGMKLIVAFNDIEIVAEKPVLPILRALAGKTERIVSIIEAEARRLGFIG